jgi:hypothetical protein
VVLTWRVPLILSGKEAPPLRRRFINGSKGIVRRQGDANVSGRYDRLDPADWIEVCRSCHAKMDNFAKNFH